MVRDRWIKDSRKFKTIIENSGNCPRFLPRDKKLELIRSYFGVNGDSTYIDENGNERGFEILKNGVLCELMQDIYDEVDSCANLFTYNETFDESDKVLETIEEIHLQKSNNNDGFHNEDVIKNLERSLYDILIRFPEGHPLVASQKSLMKRFSNANTN